MTVAMSPDLDWKYTDLLDTTSEYGEILAWVPAGYIVFTESKKDESLITCSENSKRRTLALAFFTVGFYVLEDLVTMCLTATSYGVEAAAHLLHFALLVDFGVYVVLDAFNPKQNHNTMLSQMAVWV